MRESDTIAVVGSGEWKRIEDAPKLKYVHVEGTWTKDERGRRRGPKPSEVRALRAPFEVIALRYPPRNSHASISPTGRAGLAPCLTTPSPSRSIERRAHRAAGASLPHQNNSRLSA